MTIQSDMALMAAGSYWDVRQGVLNIDTGKDTDNRAPVPEGWKVLTAYDASNTGGLVFFRNGFSARVVSSRNHGASAPACTFDTLNSLPRSFSTKWSVENIGCLS